MGKCLSNGGCLLTDLGAGFPWRSPCDEPKVDDEDILGRRLVGVLGVLEDSISGREDSFSREIVDSSAKDQASPCGRRCSRSPFSPCVWNRPRFRTSNFAKSQETALPGGGSAEIAGQINLGQSFSEIERNVCTDVDVEDIKES